MAHPIVRQSPTLSKSPHNRAVEAEMCKRGLSKTVEGAHQMLVVMNRHFPLIAESFVAAGAGERAISWIRPFEVGLALMPAGDFDQASMDEEAWDGNEGTADMALRIEPTPERWSRYKLTAYRYIGKLMVKIRAGDQKFGTVQ